MHLRKIDIADEIYVINVDGYIGESTKREIAYAEKTGKKVNYLEPVNPKTKRGTPFLRFPASPLSRHIESFRKLPASAALDLWSLATIGTQEVTRTAMVSVSILCNLTIGRIVIAVASVMPSAIIHIRI